jgi:hypothetical protein
MLALAGCRDGPQDAPAAAPVPERAEAARGETGTGSPGTTPASTAPAAAAPARAELAAAIEILSAPLRSAAGRGDNPWALAHGVLAFGPEHRTLDGTLAIDRLVSFVEEGERDTHTRLRFPREHDGRPVEPHPHIIVRAMLEAGVPLQRPLGDGAPAITPKRLLADLRAELSSPDTDAAWHEVAWGMDALTLGGDAVAPVEGLRQAALARLEAEQQVLLDSSGPAASALGPDTPLGAARRGKRAIFAHACGGLHLAQAVFRSVARDGTPAEKARGVTQLRALQRRFQIERTLYASVLRQRPDAALLIARQELKFFGHLAETLAVAEPLCETPEARALWTGLRAETLRALVDTVRRLQSLNAYGSLAALEARDHQTYLDLIGDGCHALRALRLAADG